MKKGFVINEPRKKAGEITDEMQGLLQNHYNLVMCKVCFERHIFKLVIKGNKTLISLIAGALTGFSTNILTGFLEFDKYCFIEKLQVAVILFFALILNIVVILLAAKITHIQEAGANLVVSPNQRLNIEEIRAAQNNLVYAECYDNKGYLKCTYIVSVVSAIFTIVALVFGKSIIMEVLSWINCPR